jgi:hypothetical protein
MFFSLIARIVAAGLWGAPERLGGGLLADFAKLLEDPVFVDDLDNRWLKRALLKGEFRGRKVAVLLKRGRDSPGIVVSMETHATRPMWAYEFAEYKADRDAERALFALEAKHDLGLTHESGCLKATWGGDWRFEFGFRFDRPRWQSVLEAMDTVSGSLERREAGQQAPPA